MFSTTTIASSTRMPIEKISANSERHPVQREAPGPGGEQRGGEREDHRDADDRRLAPAQRDEDQRHHRSGGEQQFLDQRRRLLAGGRAVVAGEVDLHLGRDHRVAQHLEPLADALGHRDCVLAGFLGERHGHRRALVHAHAAVVAAHHVPVPDITGWRRLAVLDAGEVAHVDRLAGAHSDQQLGHLGGAGQEIAGLDRHA
jgi:hypothetical protein